ncbi:hypothetical protein DJ533_07060 [Acinetobacter defluvii]|uniref:Uncharacterized protein n=1 Tax=Acinetobacter defluvii TaxID=1871111 RepID=A0A2S2FBL1_9GAMM|nr:hypothetical protein [Acinetobacter defluvii]AWL28344.1 hypothetical protein DJ533_07060 [Acinetobacter defluvii]
MKKRLLNVTGIILDKFTNRYHEYGNFWAIGVLYTHARHLNRSGFIFNLLDDNYIENDVFLGKVHLKFIQYLEHYLKIHNKSKQDLTAAIIKIQFDKNHLLRSTTLYGDYFTVQVELIDCKGAHFTQKSDGYCFPHTEWLAQRKLIDSLSIEEKRFY